MKALRIPAIVLAVLCLGLIIYLVFSASLLPERVATHFGGSGRPDGWMSRSTHLIFMGGIGIGLALIFSFIAMIVRVIPARFINLPRREYWLSPERRSQTCAYISRRLLWLACLEVIFFAEIHWLIIVANRTTPAHLPMQIFLPMVSAFLTGFLWWGIAFVRHFRKAV